MKRVAILLIAFSAILLSCSRRSQFLSRQLTLNEHVFRYRVWVPSHYSKLRKWPVILYLHGSGERGNDNFAQLTNGLPEALQ